MYTVREWTYLCIEYEKAHIIRPDRTSSSLLAKDMPGLVYVPTTNGIYPYIVIDIYRYIDIDRYPDRWIEEIDR